MSERTPDLHILFVCMGNICRSPTAEGMLRQRLGERGLIERVDVDSCGTGAWHVGEAPDPRAIKAALARGYDIRTLRGRQLTQQDFENFDEILVMDEDNLERVMALAPALSRAKVSRLMRYAGQPDADVPDPYFGGEAGFQHVLDQLARAVDGLVDSLEHRLVAFDG
ncbi:low molecular weight protein-tyrosine-phosphatase [Salinicola rhizosphaerae]|uniref:protein-tyrosine-phosphatase n=1 Tax=Salinicola rhizosphaerae TaxID=1443141 RepID=A0ABQ3DRF6_9GAMM|nr:low molecular weight protein-tyrosine-phosphatase [Salinicola rhizosphaerae]GHB08064.1 phosphotyrosine protein phosphatase [Salinicola rhizosphaerae]